MVGHRRHPQPARSSTCSTPRSRLLIALVIAVPLGAWVGHTGRLRWLVTGANAAARRAEPRTALRRLDARRAAHPERPRLRHPEHRRARAARGPAAAVGRLRRHRERRARGPRRGARHGHDGVAGADAGSSCPARCRSPSSGLRSATLQVIATATIAASVSLGGLGRYLIDGLASRDYVQMVCGSILVAALALVADLLLAGSGEVCRVAGNLRAVLACCPFTAPRTPAAPHRRPGRRDRRISTAAPAHDPLHHQHCRTRDGDRRLGHPIRKGPNMTRTRFLAAGLLLAAAVPLAACGGGSDPLAPADRAPVRPAARRARPARSTVGSADFPEAALLGEIYAQALEAKGITVKRQFNIGSRETYLKAITGGEVDVLPEYTGSLLNYFDKNAKVTAPDEVYAALQKALPPRASRCSTSRRPRTRTRSSSPRTPRASGRSRRSRTSPPTRPSSPSARRRSSRPASRASSASSRSTTSCPTSSGRCRARRPSRR